MNAINYKATPMIQIIFRSTLLFLISITFIVSCKKKADTPCENGGVFNNATQLCDCPVGYSGEACEIEWRAQFIGYYNMTDEAQGVGIKNYDMHVDRSLQEGNAFYLNLLNNTAKIKCYAVEGGSTFDIPVQTTNGIKYNGNAYINSSKVLHITYYETNITTNIMVTHLADGILK